VSKSMESTLKIEPAAHWAALRPADTSPETWAAIGELLRTLPAEKFVPWGSYDDVVKRLAAIPPARLRDCPEPVLAAAVQLDFEAAGVKVPSWIWKPIETDEEAKAMLDDLESIVDAAVEDHQSERSTEYPLVGPAKSGRDERTVPGDSTNESGKP
jgi:hypothetical protein